MKKILVLTATLGNRTTLKKTIESVRRIGGDVVKHVIVCPKSSIEYLRETYGDIECLAEPSEKKGIYAALNHGFNTYGRDYQYLTFINDDDYWLDDFRLLIEKIQAGYDFVYGKVDYIVDAQGCRIKPMACGHRFTDFIPLLYSNVILFTQQATLIKSELFFRLGGFSEKYRLVSDTKFWADLSLLPIKYKYIPKSCAAYTIQDGQLSSDGSLQGKEMKELILSYPSPSFLRRQHALCVYRVSNMLVSLF